ncbi:MAG: arginase [Anaerolineae bacterium]|jgi:arginase|nr:arginase [Anaerolineae bacterium]
MTTSPKVRIFGCPMDLGQRRRGVDMGPSAVRYAGLQDRLKQLGYQTADHGNIIVPQAEETPTSFQNDPDFGRAYFLPEVAHVCELIFNEIDSHLHSDELGIFLGGDHTISIGTVSAVAKHERVGVLWIDAHADMNTPRTSPSGNIHGMSVAALLGDCPPILSDVGFPGPKLQPDQIAMIGVRNLDHEERIRVAKSGMSVFTMREVDELGMSDVAARVLDFFDRFDHLHISLDLDSCDPSIAPGVGTPVLGGLSYREAHLLMEILADSQKVRTLDVVEINPILDNKNATAEIAVDLIASLFGQRIIDKRA